MQPPIPSPSARDCPQCGAQIENARLQFCPQCGASLQNRAQLSIATIIGVTLLGIICVPMGACSILFGFSAVTTPDTEGFSGLILVVSGFCLLLAALGIWSIANTLRKK
jgi:hypothetical protein